MTQQDRRVVRFVKAWRVRFAVAMVVLYGAAVAVLVWRFPDVSNLWVSIFVLASGFFSGLATLADLLVSASTDRHD